MFLKGLNLIFLNLQNMGQQFCFFQSKTSRWMAIRLTKTGHYETKPSYSNLLPQKHSLSNDRSKTVNQFSFMSISC